MSKPNLAFLSLIRNQRRLLLVCGMVLSGILLGLWKPYVPIPAPANTFISITGHPINLPALKGKPVLINFWATDCSACIKEIPHLIELYQQYHAKGLEVIAVAMYYDIPSHVVEMTRAKQIPYPVALDLNAQHANAFGQVQLTPTTFLISPDGFILSKFIGKLPADLATQITNLL